MEVNLKDLVQQAAKEKGITGVMLLCQECKMDYRKAIKVWRGDKTAKLSHVEHVFNTLGYQLKVVKVKDND